MSRREERERHQRQSVIAGWLLRLTETADVRVELDPTVRSLLVSMREGASWKGVCRRLDEHQQLTYAVGIGAVAAWSVTQSYRVPSLVAPMLVEFRDWFLVEAGRLHWEAVGIGVDDALFLAELGMPFKQEV